MQNGTDTMLKLLIHDTDVRLELNGRPLLSAEKDKPLIYVGHGQEMVDEYRGHYYFSDRVTERRGLAVTKIQPLEQGVRMDFGQELELTLSLAGDAAELTFQSNNPALNRFWLRLDAQEEEHIYGCGEQFSYFDLRGRHFPLWTSEPGVGRNPASYAWQEEEKKGHHGGGSYHTTYVPQQTFVSSRHYYLNVVSSAYGDFDFRDPQFHELQIWEVPKKIRIEAADTFPRLLEKLTAQTGRQQELPDWVYNGLIIGVQDGSERVQRVIQAAEDCGISVAAVWCQDWSGQRITSFGKRVMWNWTYEPKLYPDLPGFIQRLHEKNIRFLGYLTPFLCSDGPLYQQAREKGYLVLGADGEVRLIDFGEFHCGLVDLTNPEAEGWFQEEIIQHHCLDIGMDGWMADFGEYLPTRGLRLHNGGTPMLEHNLLPERWAKCNFDALSKAGKLGQVLYFMRSGAFGCQKHSTLLWAGDQLVDYSRHDGLPTVICAALSAGLTGYGLTHSDIGGYTSLYGVTRTKELFLRWAELAVFTPVMRTHEGNRPRENFQFYDDEDCMRQLARLVEIHRRLAAYIQAQVRQNAQEGLPVQRPLFLHYEEDAAAYSIQDEYLFGRDLLVAPVLAGGQETRTLHLPPDEWVHLWTGTVYPGGQVTVDAPLGKPPVFYRKDSAWATQFAALRSL